MKMPLSRRYCQLLARVNFPPYTVHCLTERHIFVAGGGGSSKTGIRNVIEVYELSHTSSDGCRAKSIAHYETGSQAIMNCAVFNAGSFFILFAGMEGICQLYKLKFRVQSFECMPNGCLKDLNAGTAKNNSLRARGIKNSREKDSGTSDAKDDVNYPQPQKADNGIDGSQAMDLVLDISPLESFQTDFSDDPFQKLARFSPEAKLLATAGADGHIRVWKYPEMKKLYEVHAHQDDVDDLDISPLGDKIVSVSRDGYGKVWNAKDGSLVCDLQYDLPKTKTASQYTFRGCRYAIVEGNKENTALFITLNPSVRRKPPLPSYISKLNGATFTVEKMVSAGHEMLSAICVSDDGNFVGLGTQEGTVKIYIAFSLQLLYRADHVHSIFVTGLEFLPSCEASRRITGYEASLISISVDNHINVHHVPHRATIGAFTVIIMFVIILFFMFVIMDYFSL